MRTKRRLATDAASSLLCIVYSYHLFEEEAGKLSTYQEYYSWHKLTFTYSEATGWQTLPKALYGRPRRVAANFCKRIGEQDKAIQQVGVLYFACNI